MSAVRGRQGRRDGAGGKLARKRDVTGCRVRRGTRFRGSRLGKYVRLNAIDSHAHPVEGDKDRVDCVAEKAMAVRYFGSRPHPRPGWRNWQTQQTQNLPALVVMGVRPPLPAPDVIIFRINKLKKVEILCA